jgi:hypothetical protein
MGGEWQGENRGSEAIQKPTLKSQLAGAGSILSEEAQETASVNSSTCVEFACRMADCISILSQSYRGD